MSTQVNLQTCDLVHWTRNHFILKNYEIQFYVKG